MKFSDMEPEYCLSLVRVLKNQAVVDFLTSHEMSAVLEERFDWIVQRYPQFLKACELAHAGHGDEAPLDITPSLADMQHLGRRIKDGSETYSIGFAHIHAFIYWYENQQEDKEPRYGSDQ